MEKEPFSNFTQIATFCPEPYTHITHQLLIELGIEADQINQTVGISIFRPLPGSNPTEGAPGKIHRTTETKIQAIIPASEFRRFCTNLSTFHPFETFVIESYGLDHCEPIPSDIPPFKVVVTSPNSSVNITMDLLAQHGVGHIGSYDYCFFIYPASPHTTTIESLYPHYDLQSLQAVSLPGQLTITHFQHPPVYSHQPHLTIASSTITSQLLTLFRQNN